MGIFGRSYCKQQSERLKNILLSSIISYLLRMEVKAERNIVSYDFLKKSAFHCPPNTYNDYHRWDFYVLCLMVFPRHGGLTALTFLYRKAYVISVVLQITFRVSGFLALWR